MKYWVRNELWITQNIKYRILVENNLVNINVNLEITNVVIINIFVMLSSSQYKFENVYYLLYNKSSIVYKHKQINSIS